MVRVFIAVDFEDDEIKTNIRKIQDELKKTNNILKFVDPNLAHLTLVFLGEQTEERVEEIKEVMAEIELPKMKFELKGIGVFPNQNYIRVIWTEVVGDTVILEKIHKELVEKLNARKFKFDTKPLKPHVTIARVKAIKNKENIKLTLNKLQKMKLGAVEVDAIKLKQSVLRPTGPEYTTLYSKMSVKN